MKKQNIFDISVKIILVSFFVAIFVSSFALYRISTTRTLPQRKAITSLQLGTSPEEFEKVIGPPNVKTKTSEESIFEYHYMSNSFEIINLWIHLSENKIRKVAIMNKGFFGQSDTQIFELTAKKSSSSKDFSEIFQDSSSGDLTF